MYYHDLTDLINREAAYTFYYSLAPSTQELLRDRTDGSLAELRRAAEDGRVSRQPRVF